MTATEKPAPEFSVLMLEGSALDMELSVKRLRKAGLRPDVTRVDSRKDFINALEATRFDIILADYDLPGFDGISALDIAHEKHPEVPFVFVSGMLGEEVAIDTLQRGATDYVLKNRLERLPPAVERALAQARERARASEAERALAASDIRFHQLADSMPQIVWAARPDGATDYLNQRWYDFLGKAPIAEPGLKLSSYLHPDDLPEVRDRWYECVRTGEPFERECRLRDQKNGAYVWFLIRALAVRDPETGKVQRWYGTCTDIDNQKRTEESLRRSNEDLEQFAYVSSHDLQEPLRTIASYSQLLAKRYRGKLDEDADQFIKYMVDAAQRMGTLIKDLLEYSRATREQQRTPTSTESRQAVETACRNLHASIQITGATIEIGELPTVMADPVQVAILFQNLIGNALKYSRASVAPHVSVQAEREGADWIFSVRDNGVGFEPQFAQRIFGLFKRLHGHEYPGTGIGLAICKTIVERHGGRIWAESTAGQGSTFYFTLPARS